MIRKQVYLKAHQDRKLKTLAAQRRCTEAEVIREAVDRLPDPTGDAILLRLDTVGLLAPEPAAWLTTRGGSDVADAESVARLEADHEAWLAARAESLGLVEALHQDRARR